MSATTKPYRIDLALKVIQAQADYVIWLTYGKAKGAFIFRPSEIEHLDDLDKHFYPSFGLDQVDDLKKLLGGASYHFRATRFELRGIMKNALTARMKERLK